MDRRGFLQQGAGAVAGVALSGLVPVSAVSGLTVPSSPVVGGALAEGAFAEGAFASAFVPLFNRQMAEDENAAISLAEIVSHLLEAAAYSQLIGA